MKYFIVSSFLSVAFLLNSIVCQVAVAATTTAEAKVANECEKEALKLNDVFGEFSAQMSGEATLITTEIFSGFSEFTTTYSESWRDKMYPKALGFRLTGSTQADTSTAEEFANASLLLRDGALIGLTLSFMGSPRWNHYKGVSNCDVANTNKHKRNFMTDRTYLATHPIMDSLIKPYFVHGLTFKALRKSNADEEDKNKGDITGALTFYAGLGFDGFIHALGETNPTHETIAGKIDIRGGWQTTKIGASALQDVYDDDSITDDRFQSLFAVASIHITDKFSIEIEHVNPEGEKEYLNEVTSFRLGYKL